MREMGYQVARAHAREAAQALRCCCCSRCRSRWLLLLLAPLPRAVQIARRRAVALSSATAGVLIERWLFFAEAEHVVMVYYRGGSA